MIKKYYDKIKNYIQSKYISLKNFYQYKVKKKIYLYNYKISKIYNHENVHLIRRNYLVWLLRLSVMLWFAFMILLVLRFVGYEITWMNYISAFALLMLLQEVPPYIKRCRR